MKFKDPSKRRVILFIAMSLDGYIADEQGSVEWLEQIEGEGDNGYNDFIEQVDTIFMGRHTYEVIQGFDMPFPYQDKQCYVFSRSSQQADEHVTPIQEELTSWVPQQLEQSGKHIWLMGGGQLVHEFLQHHWIDEMIITIAPVMLGSGIPLFREGFPTSSWIAQKTRSYGQLVTLHYVKPDLLQSPAPDQQ